MTEPSSRPNEESLPRLPGRPVDAHKGHFGTALVVGGSIGMSGAAVLAGMGALRGGAGLVRLAVPEPCLGPVAACEPSYMTAALPADSAGRIAASARHEIVALAESATVLVCGPGMGRSSELDELVGWLYASITRPIVVDADGLNALSTQPEVLEKPGGPRILTPHPGEFARLLGTRRVPPDGRQQAAAEMAARCGVVIVLKGHGTCVTDGETTWVNSTGNPGMATGGSGDVLSGLIAAIWCQGLAPLDAARLGVYLHGLAGDLAAEQLGQASMIASDIVRFLPQAFEKPMNGK